MPHTHQGTKIKEQKTTTQQNHYKHRRRGPPVVKNPVIPLPALPKIPVLGNVLIILDVCLFFSFWVPWGVDWSLPFPLFPFVFLVLV